MREISGFVRNPDSKFQVALEISDRKFHVPLQVPVRKSRISLQISDHRNAVEISTFKGFSCFMNVAHS